ncbi:MAG: efflux RND transporter periplasmic adaptor subunit [Bacteroidaceae bacterium]|nr:efflux RND transporter periplasmic adaptor subunit [Bacteroidaceae bacterium]
MRKKYLFFQCVSVALFVATLTGCSSKGGEQQNTAGQQQTAYQFLTVEKGERTLDQAYSATIRGRQDVAIMPQVGGTIKQVCVTEGQQVHAGQTLFIIDQVPFQAALCTAEANVKAAKAQLATAKLNYESNQELFRQQVVSQHTLTTAENAYLTAQAGLAQAQAAETNARNSLSYTYVKAPANGQVGNLPYRTGDLVGPQIPTPLTTVSDNSEMWVYFSMTENQFLGFSREFGSINEAARQMPAVSLQLKDGSTYEAEGRIESVSAVIDRSTGTATCKAVFPNKKGLLHSGLSGTVLIPTTYKDVIIIPQSAAVSQQDKYIVYKVGKDGMAEGVLVKVAPINDGKEFIVTEGLNAGDEILATGAGLVRPGTKLK